MNESKETWSVKPFIHEKEAEPAGPWELNRLAHDQAEALLNAASRAKADSVGAASGALCRTGHTYGLGELDNIHAAVAAYSHAANEAWNTLGLRVNESCRELADDLDGNPHVDQETAYAQSKPVEQMLDAVSKQFSMSAIDALTTYQENARNLVVELAAGNLGMPATQGDAFKTPSEEFQDSLRRGMWAAEKSLVSALSELKTGILGIATMVIQEIIPTTAPAKPTTPKALAAHAHRLTTACLNWRNEMVDAWCRLDSAGVGIRVIAEAREIFG